MFHYQKFAKYQRNHRRNFFCRYFSVEITYGLFLQTENSELMKKGRVGGAEVLASDFSDGITNGLKTGESYA